MEEKVLTVTLEQLKGFEFLVKFDEKATLLMDEPPPIGDDKGPSASKVLSASIGNCLSASLLFCLQKARVETKNMRTTVKTRLVRNEKKRLRIGSSEVEIIIDADRGAENRLQRCIELFEDFCIVTASVRNGMDVSVVVKDEKGNEVYKSD